MLVLTDNCNFIILYGTAVQLNVAVCFGKNMFTCYHGYYNMDIITNSMILLARMGDIM